LATRTILAVLLAALSATTSQASGRKQLWSLDLLKLTGQAGDPDAQYVWGLALSPDEMKLAIGFNHRGDAAGSRVIVVAVDNPRNVLRKFGSDRTHGLELFIRENLQWSPSGKLLAAYSKVFSLENERVCQGPTDFEFGGFLADDRIVFGKAGLPFNRFKPGSEDLAEIQVLRPDCSIEDSWQMPSRFSWVRGTCPLAGFIEVHAANWPKGDAAETHLLKYPGHTTARQWRWDALAVVSGTIFTDSCKTICAGEGHVNDRKAWSHAACWSTSTGEKILEDTRLTRTDREAYMGVGGALLAVTVSHWACNDSKFLQALDMGGCASRPTGRVLWNIETGQQVLSWPVREQQISIGDRKSSTPFALSLSATGKYLAEGGSGRVQLYAVR
jgi:hypothetical protein